MEKSIPEKIHIIGSVGSGKTTCARSLSIKLDLPFYELDNVVWKRTNSGDVRRTESERDETLQSIISQDRWIVEGAHTAWVNPSFEQADVIIFLDTSYLQRIYRIVKRFLLQKAGLEKANYKPTLKIFRRMFEWNTNFEKIIKPELLEALKAYEGKVLILNDNREIEKHL